MTNTTVEIISVNGTVLNTLAKNVETLAKTLRVPGQRSQMLTAAGRHGGIIPTRSYYDALTLAWPMWVAGCDDDGQIPVGQTSRKLFYTNLDALTRLFAAPTLDIRHTLPNATIRQIFGRVITTIDFSTSGINPTGRFSVEILCVDPFWQDTADITQGFGIGGTNANLTLTSFDGATAPMSDMAITFTGPMNNPKITNPITGAWFQYNHVFTGGTGITVNCRTWTITGNGGHVVDYAKAVHAGGGRFFEITPPSAGPPTVTFLSTGGSGGNVSFTGRRKFLVG